MKRYLDTNWRSYRDDKAYDYWCMLSDMYNILVELDVGKVEGVSQRNYYITENSEVENSEVETELGETEDEAKLCAMISQR